MLGLCIHSVFTDDRASPARHKGYGLKCPGWWECSFSRFLSAKQKLTQENSGPNSCFCAFVTEPFVTEHTHTRIHAQHAHVHTHTQCLQLMMVGCVQLPKSSTGALPLVLGLHRLRLLLGPRHHLVKSLHVELVHVDLHLLVAAVLHSRDARSLYQADHLVQVRQG